MTASRLSAPADGRGFFLVFDGAIACGDRQRFALQSLRDWPNPRASGWTREVGVLST